MPRSPLADVVRHIHALAARAPGPAPPDRILLERFLHQRDEAAFAMLVRRHGGLVLSVARRILHDAHAAEDIFQNTFLTLARRAASIRKHDALSSWLYGVATRLASQARLQEARRRKHEEAATSPPSQDVTEAATWRELGALLDEELQRLPEKYQMPLVLIYFAGQTQEAAAAQLGWSKGTLRRRLDRGKQLLHDRLLRRGVSLSVGLLATAIAQSAADAALPAALIQRTVAEAVKVVTTQATGWLIGMISLTRAKIALALGLLLAMGGGLAVFPMMPRQPAEEKPRENAPPPARETKQPRVDRFGDPLPEGVSVRLGTMRFRHAAGTSLAFVPDGKTLLTCGGDRTIRTWDAVSGRLLQEQRLPPGLLSTVAVLSPTGRLLVFEDKLSPLALWDVSRHQFLHRRIDCKCAWPRAVFSPDEKTLATGEQDGAVRAWDVATGKDRLLGQHKGDVFSLEFTAKGTLMSLGDDQTVRIWDVAAGRERSHFTVPKEVVAAAISPDGKIVATWTFWNEELKRELQFWDAASGEPKEDWKAPDMRGIHALRFLPDGKTILVGAGEQGDVRLWDAAVGKLLHTLAGQSGCQFVLSSDSKTAASLGGVLGRSHCMESMVHVWDLSTGARRTANHPEHGHLGRVDAVAFAPDGRTIASFCPVDHQVHLWDAVSSRLLRSFSLRKDSVIGPELSFSPDGKDLLIATGFAAIRVEAATGREVNRHRLLILKEDRSNFPLMIQGTGDGRTLLALTQNQSGKGAPYDLHSWDAVTGKRLRSVPFSVDVNWGSHFSPSARFLGRFSPDGRFLVMPDGSVLDTETGKEAAHLTIKGESSLGAPVAFSPDGALIALGIWQVVRREGSGWRAAVAVQIWETATLLPVTRLETGELNHLAFTPDGRHLITTGIEMLTRWDLASGRLVARRRIPGGVRDIAGGSLANAFRLAPDGRTVAMGQADTTILLWDLPSLSPERPAAPLTAAQREEYWTDLTRADAGRAFTAIARLADAPAQTLTMLRGRLKPVRAPAADELRRLIADLDHERFERREAATQRLCELAELAEAALREALRSKPSLEMRRRLDDLVAESRLVRMPEERRQLRAIHVLESIGTAEARQILKMLAEGAVEARLTQEAKAALRRLARRP